MHKQRIRRWNTTTGCTESSSVEGVQFDWNTTTGCTESSSAEGVQFDGNTMTGCTERSSAEGVQFDCEFDLVGAPSVNFRDN